MFIFQKTYTRNGLFKGRKNFLVVTASTYVKLQQTYFAENNQIGDWDMVGYIAPNGGSTTNFFYGDGIAHSGSASQNATDVIGWAADNKITLNECVAGTNITTAKSATASNAANWIVKVSVNTGTTADVKFESSAKTAGCTALTPSFSNIK